MEDHGVNTEKSPQYSNKNMLNLQNLTRQRFDRHQGHLEVPAASTNHQLKPLLILLGALNILRFDPILACILR